MSILNSENVESIFLDCLFKDGESTDNHIKIEGITMTVGFHPDRLQNCKEAIEAMLNELPDNFKKGCSFLNACNDKYENQWTGFHQSMEQLFMLGMAIDKVKCLLPKEMWSVLPGGMPYYIINN